MQVDSEGAPAPREFMDAVWGAFTRLYGEYGASLTGLTLIDYSAEERTAVVRCTLESLGLVRAALASLTMVAGREAAVHVVAVSGTIKSLGKQ